MAPSPLTLKILAEFDRTNRELFVHWFTDTDPAPEIEIELVACYRNAEGVVYRRESVRGRVAQLEALPAGDEPGHAHEWELKDVTAGDVTAPFDVCKHCLALAIPGTGAVVAQRKP